MGIPALAATIVIDTSAAFHKLVPLLKVNKNIYEALMNNTKFKPLFLLALLFPLLGAGLGYMLSSVGTQPPSQSVSSLPAGQPGDPIVIVEPDEQLPAAKSSAPDSLELAIFIALVCGSVALLCQYLNTPLGWVAVILIALVFSLLYHDRIGIPLTQFFLINLGLGILLTLLIELVFFQRSLLRWRMIVTSLLGAGLIALYYWGMYQLTKNVFESGKWSGFFVNGLLMFVFISFAMSLADLVIQRSEVRELQSNRASANEDEDA